MPQLQVEHWPVEKLIPYRRNARTHSDEQVAQIAASIVEFGWTNPVLIGADGVIIAGHARLQAARKLQLREVPVIVLDHLSATQRRALILADNKLALNAGWDEELLAEELAELAREGLDLGVVGFGDAELNELLAVEENAAAAAVEEAEVPEAPAVVVTQPGDLWLIGPHRLLCGDCRESRAIARLFDAAKANVVVTSPPYATQREYDPASGFKPVPPEEYGAWFRDIAANIATVLTSDGSYLLNLKEHAEDGQRSLYVKDLVIAHVREWGWRFVDEFCWRKTDNGVPGGWNNRFKNAWEPVFHFCLDCTSGIKFRPEAVSHISEDCFDYSPDNPKSTSGSGLLGAGPRGDAAGSPGAVDDDGRRRGLARPSNVIEARTESFQGAHSAPFPRAVPEFFIKAFSDAGDVVFDPFTGSGTTMAAAALLGRTGYGAEISPSYCDVILRRIAAAIEAEPVLTATGQKLSAVAAERGVTPDGDADLRVRDAKSIRRKPNGMPCCAPRRRKAPKN